VFSDICTPLFWCWKWKNTSWLDQHILRYTYNSKYRIKKRNKLTLWVFKKRLPTCAEGTRVNRKSFCAANNTHFITRRHTKIMCKQQLLHLPIHNPLIRVRTRAAYVWTLITRSNETRQKTKIGVEKIAVLSELWYDMIIRIGELYKNIVQSTTYYDVIMYSIIDPCLVLGWFTLI